MSNFPRPLSESFSLMSPRTQQSPASDTDNVKANSDHSHSPATTDTNPLRSADNANAFAHMSQQMNTSHRPSRPMTEIFTRQSAESKLCICLFGITAEDDTRMSPVLRQPRGFFISLLTMLFLKLSS